MKILSKRMRRKVKYGALYVAIKILLGIAAILPQNIWLSVAGFFGLLIYYLSSRLRRQISTHLTVAYKDEMTQNEIRSLSKQVMIMLAKNAAAVVKAFKITSQEDFQKICKVKGYEHAQQAYSRGRGVIFLTAHLGPFELVGTELALRGYHPLIIGTPMKDPRLNELLLKQRSKLGAIPIERGKETFRIMKNIETGGTMAILIDQDTKVKSVFVNFFGIPCSTPVGATLLALRTGAAVIPIFAHLLEDGTYEVTYYPEVTLERTGDTESDIVTNTQRFTDIIEKEIRKYPAQWVWMHNRWKTKPMLNFRSSSSVNSL